MSERRPQTRRPNRIGPLANLPVFFRLSGKKVVLLGSSEAAFWKAELLAAAGAHLDVYSVSFSDDFINLATDPSSGKVNLYQRHWQDSDFQGAVFAIADLDDEDEIQAFISLARRIGIPINVIDKPHLCTFQFGSIVNRSPLVVGISTDGAAPVFGQAIRQKIEAILPLGLAAWADAARAWRPFVQSKSLGFSARRDIWEKFTKIALSAPNRKPSLLDRDALVSQVQDLMQDKVKGRITLVGAGPGDPELLTMKALRVLQSADVILHDDLVTPEILELARREAKRVMVGKKGHGPSCKQTDINDMMVSFAQQGAHVVRLKSGDPGIFGRATEELEAARRANIEISIVPGVTAAQGAAASLGLALTERKLARRVQFLTGHGQDGKLPRDISWEAMADPTATTILYMPRKTLAEFSAKTLSAGLSPETPVVIVMNATRPNQESVSTTVSRMAYDVDLIPDLGPVLIMIGQPFAVSHHKIQKDHEILLV